MTKVPIYDLNASKIGKIDLPEVFSTPFRPDIIHRAHIALSSNKIQPQGRDPMAGKKTSASTYNPPTGRGISRVPRVKGERNPRSGQAAGIASVVKGRQAHPPRSEKRIRKEINKKERWLATASSIASSANRELVALRGHKISKVPTIPLVVSDEIQSIEKAKDLRSLFEKFGLDEDVDRAAGKRKTRSGKPRMRGRTKRTAKGPLIVVAEDRGIGKAARNFQGVDLALAKDLSVLHLAPGSHPGRLVLWSESALKSLNRTLMEVARRFAS
ncbi:MAG: 50S ribosomal protein L4 [archaeon]|nr:50S ribosomal protein L4 [archaeon]MCP8306465.1 50S ribosomal protein L4 [archaeon]